MEFLAPTIQSLLPSAHPIGNYVRLWGGATSLTALDPLCTIFTVRGIEGAIAYRIEKGCAVVFGDPLCKKEDRKTLTLSFHAHCRKKNLSLVYVTVTKEFADWALENGLSISIGIGDELWVNPEEDPSKGGAGRVIRRKTSHARRAGVAPFEFFYGESPLKEAIEKVGIAWLEARKGPQIFFAHMTIFDETEGRRWFYAQQGEKTIGVLVMNRVEAREGWVLHLLMVIPDAPAGTSELLVMEAVETLRKEGCAFLSFGVAQGASLGVIQGLGPFSTWIARHTFALAQRLFSLNGRRRFWEKFQPKNEPSLILFGKKRLGIRELIAMMRAFNVSI